MQYNESEVGMSDPLNRLLDVAFPGPLTFAPDGDEQARHGIRVLSEGQVVDDFELVTLLGQGGMGQVWEARQRSLGGRRVAIKFVRPERVTERELEFFGREARAGGRLSHPGLVAVHSYGNSDGLAWIAMELVERGWTLRDSLDERRRTDELPQNYDREVARIVIEIADAMQAAHDAGVVHRDLKPQNVLVTRQGRAKVTDFGLARIQDESGLSRTGDLAGTYAYMSPEQLNARRREDLDHRTDVFSLGVVMYELLALQRPFQGDTESQIAEQIMRVMPADPRTIRSRIPRDLAVIAMHALEKRRADRFASMADLAADLRRFLRHEAILSRPPTAAGKAMRWMRRHPTTSLAAGALAITLFAGGSGYRTVLAARSERDAESFERRILEFSATLVDLNRQFTRFAPKFSSPNEVVEDSGDGDLDTLTVASTPGGLQGANTLSAEQVAERLLGGLESIAWGLEGRSLEEWTQALEGRGDKLEAIAFLAETLLILGAGQPEKENWLSLVATNPRVAAAWHPTKRILDAGPESMNLAFEVFTAHSTGAELVQVSEQDLAAMGPIELDWLARVRLESGERTRAVELLDRALLDSPGRFQTHSTRADIAFREKDWESMRAHALACVSLDPGSGYGWRVFGRANLETRDLSADRRRWAVVAYERAIELTPKVGSNYVELADMLPDRQEKRVVLEAGRLAASPPDPWIYMNLVRLLSPDFERGDPIVAEALEVFPDNPRLLHNIAHYYLDKAKTLVGVQEPSEEVDLAINALEHAVEVDDSYWMIWALLTHAYNRKHNAMSEDDPDVSFVLEHMSIAAKQTYALKPNKPGVLFNLINARFNTIAVDPTQIGAAFFEENLPLLETIADYESTPTMLRMLRDNLGVMNLSAEEREEFAAHIDAILGSE